MFCPWCGGHMGLGWGGLLGLLLILFLGAFLVALIGLGVWALIRSSQGRSGDGRGAQRDRALDILQERYARGEITREEYEERRRDLTP